MIWFYHNVVILALTYLKIKNFLRARLAIHGAGDDPARPSASFAAGVKVFKAQTLKTSLVAQNADGRGSAGFAGD